MIKKIIISILTFNLLFLIAGCSSNETVAYFGKNEISKKEFSFAADVCKSETILYFTSKYDVSSFSSDDFWETEFGEDKETPIDVLKDKALKYLSDSHAVFSLCEQEGIVEDASFENIEKMYQKENEKRENNESYEIIYGVTSFDFASYYDWFLSNCKLELEKVMQEKISTEDIKAYYGKNKDKIAAKPLVYTCEQYKIDYDEKILDKINLLIENKTKFEKIGAEIGGEKTEVSYNMGNEKALSVETPNLLTELKKCSAGEIILSVDANIIYIINVKEISDLEYEEIESVSSKIKALIAKDRLDKKIEKTKNNNKIKKTDWLNQCRWQDLKEIE